MTDHILDAGKMVAPEILAERERIAAGLEYEADMSPCSEDASVLRGAAWLVRADFSYDDAERLQIAAEAAEAGDVGAN